MPKLIPERVQEQLNGLANMTAHARRLYQQGVLDAGELRKIEVFEAEQRFGPLMDVESYAAARSDGTWDRYEQVLKDPRSGTSAERELLARRVAAHKIGQDAVNSQPQTEAEQKAIMKAARERMSTFVDMSDEDADDDLAVYEKAAKITLRDEVRKPVEEPSWAKPLQKLSDDDPDVRAFKLRDENTPGTRRHSDAHDAFGEKRDAKGRYIPKNVLREDADRIPARKNSTFEEDVKRAKSEYDDTRGYTVDKEYGVRSAEEAREIMAYEASRADDAAAAAEASPPPPSEPGPVILPNPAEA